MQTLVHHPMEEENNIGTVTKVPNIALPFNIRFIDDVGEPKDRVVSAKINRGETRHGSLKCKKQNGQRRLCRYHSDASSNPLRFGPEHSNPAASSSSRNSSCRRNSSGKVRRSASAVEGHRCNVKVKVKRSVSDRSSIIIAGKHLAPPNPKMLTGRDHPSEGRSSKCSSSSRTLTSHASLSEVVAAEFGMKNVPGLSAKEARRKRIVCTVAIIGFTLLIVSILLVAVTLSLSPVVDAVLRKENEDIYRAMSAGPTPAPSAANNVANGTSTSVQPG